MSAIKNVDSDTTKVMNDIMKALFERLSQNTKDELQRKKRNPDRELTGKISIELPKRKHKAVETKAQDS